MILCLLAAPLAAQNAGETCLSPPFDEGPAELRSMVADLREAVADFPSLNAALADPMLDICVSDSLFGELGYLEADTARIVLRADLEPGLRRAVLLHELRHLDQLRLGACPSPALSMRENARAVFAIEADANAIALLVAWHLKTDGDPQVWQALENWDSTTDIAAAFSAEMEATADPARAAAAAFAAWYASDIRRERYYLSSCNAYLDRQDRMHSLAGTQQVEAGYFTALCRMPDGATYPCAEPEDAVRR